MRFDLSTVTVKQSSIVGQIVICPVVLSQLVLERAYCTLYIDLAKPLSKLHASNNRSNTDYDPQDIPLHSRMVNKIG